MLAPGLLYLPLACASSRRSALTRTRPPRLIAESSSTAGLSGMLPSGQLAEFLIVPLPGASCHLADGLGPLAAPRLQGDSTSHRKRAQRSAVAHAELSINLVKMNFYGSLG
jgi:hypothetical protein